MYARLGAALLAVAAGAAGILVAVLLLRSVPGPPSTAAAPVAPAPAATAPSPAVSGGRISTPNDQTFPSPPPGALVLAREDVTRDVAVAVERGLVRVSVVGGDGNGVRGLDVSVETGGAARRAAACGPGCYQARIARPASPLTVRYSGRAFVFTFPALPAPSASAIVRHAVATWNALHTLVWHEALGSSPTDVIHTVYRAVAPDRLSYTIRGLSAAVIIGGSRWDRATPTSPWQRSIQDPPIRQPQPFWHGFVDAHVLGSTTFAGQPVWRVSFFDPSTPSWFDTLIDKRSYRTLKLDMIAAAHFMHHVYGPFDAPVQVVPPT